MLTTVNTPSVREWGRGATLRVTARTGIGTTMPDDSALSDEELARRHSELLRRFLAVNSLTAADFGRRYGVEVRSVERYLKGSRIDPRRRDLNAVIAYALGIPLAAWLTNPPEVQLTPLGREMLRVAGLHALERGIELADRKGQRPSTPTPRRRRRSPVDRQGG